MDRRGNKRGTVPNDGSGPLWPRIERQANLLRARHFRRTGAIR